MTSAVDRRDWPWLPDMLRYLAEAAGLGPALQLAVDFGGQKIYVPKTATPRHPIAKAIGLPALKALCNKYGGSHVDIPLGTDGHGRKRARRIAQLDDQGYSANRIARAVNTHERTVHRHRAKRRDGTGLDTRQPKLI